MTAMISRYISEQEAFFSPTAKRLGIDNRATSPIIINNMKLVATQVFDPLRLALGVPIMLSSFYRCPALNKAVGGSPTSQHATGQAMDIDADILGGTTNREVFDHIRQRLPFDQLIWEFGNDQQPDWVHVSYKEKGNRQQVLKAIRVEGKTRYIPYDDE